MDRKRLETEILEQAQNNRIPCSACFRIAEEFEISRQEMGEILDEMKIKVGWCQLGCFD